MKKIKVHCSYTKMVDINTLKPNDRNPCHHPEEQIQLLAKIIEHQGWRNPIVISKRSGFITKGHGRLLAARKLAAKEVPVDVQDYASEAEELADMIADNRISELSEFSRTDLQEVLSNIHDSKLDLDLTGFDSVMIANLTAEISETGSKEEKSIDADGNKCPRCGFLLPAL